MKKIFTAIFFQIIFFVSYGQMEVGGKIINKNQEGISGAYLNIWKDKQFITYSQTSENGTFHFKIKERGEYHLQILAEDYEPLDTLVFLPSDIPLVFVLRQKTEQLDEVVLDIKHYEQIFKGDTIKYQLKNIRSGKEQNLRELLQKLPGVEVNENQIVVNGKQVDKLLINGKDLFEKNKKLALDNLPAEAVKSVEYYNNYHNPFSIYPGHFNTQTTALNIGIDKKYTGNLRGDLLAQGGYRKKYAVHANGYLFKSSSMHYFIANANNTGKEVFGISDYLNILLETGGFSERITIPSVLLDKKKAAVNRNRFLSYHFLYQPNEKSQIKAYVLRNESFKETFRNTQIYFYDPGVAGIQEKFEGTGQGDFVLGVMQWQMKANEHFSVSTQVYFTHNHDSTTEDIDNQNAFVRQGKSNRGDYLKIIPLVQWMINEETFAEWRVNFNSMQNVNHLEVHVDDSLSNAWYDDQALQKWSSERNRLTSNLKLYGRSFDKNYWSADLRINWEDAKRRLNFSSDLLDFFSAQHVKRFDKTLHVEYTLRWGKWKFTPGVDYLFTSIMPSGFERYDQDGVLPNFNMVIESKIFRLTSSYQKRWILTDYTDWEDNYRLSSYNRILYPVLRPGLIGFYHDFSVNIFPRFGFSTWHWILYASYQKSVGGKIESIQYRDNLYYVYGIEGRTKEKWNLSFTLEKKIGRSLKVKYLVDPTWSKAYLPVQNRFVLQRHFKLNQRIELLYSPRKKPYEWRLRYERSDENFDNLQNASVYWFENKWEGAFIYQRAKWNFRFSAHYITQFSDAFRRLPLVLKADFHYLKGKKWDWFIEAYNFLNLNDWSQPVYRYRTYSYEVEVTSNLPGYVSLGVKYLF